MVVRTAVNTWKLWEKLGMKQKVIAADADSDIKAIQQYLDDVHYDVKELRELLVKLRGLRKEWHVLTDEVAANQNLRKQIQVYDQLLSRYEYFDHDAEINGIRIKNVAKDYVEQVKKRKMYDLTEKLKKDSRWFFDW